MVKFKSPLQVKCNTGGGRIALEIEADLRKYCLLKEDGTCIDEFVCPVEGCGFTTRLGPGALRMHLLMKSDPNVESRYCEAHERFCHANIHELGMDAIRYLSSLPRIKVE